MIGPAPVLKLATNAVGSPATPAFTVKPAAFKRDCSSAELCVSR